MIDITSKIQSSKLSADEKAVLTSIDEQIDSALCELIPCSEEMALGTASFFKNPIIDFNDAKSFYDSVIKVENKWFYMSCVNDDSKVSKLIEHLADLHFRNEIEFIDVPHYLNLASLMIYENFESEPAKTILHATELVWMAESLDSFYKRLTHFLSIYTSQMTATFEKMAIIDHVLDENAIWIDGMLDKTQKTTIREAVAIAWDELNYRLEPQIYELATSNSEREPFEDLWLSGQSIVTTYMIKYHLI